MNIQLPRAVIFDLDDTILADAEASRKGWEQTFAKFGPRLGMDGQELSGALSELRRQLLRDQEWNQWAGLNPDESRRQLVDMTLSSRGLNEGQIANEIVETYAGLKIASMEAFPGAIDTLIRIREMGKAMALITNGQSGSQRGKIELLGLESLSLFDCIIVEGDFGVGKPDAKVFRHALEQLGAQPSEAVMIGDNLYADIAGAQALGISTIWVDWRGKGLPEGSQTTPDAIVRSVAELLA